MTYTIKPLVWAKSAITPEWWSVETLFGTMAVFNLGNDYWRWKTDSKRSERHLSFESCRDEAEAHYRERLMQALEPVTARGGAGVLVNEREG